MQPAQRLFIVYYITSHIVTVSTLPQLGTYDLCLCAHHYLFLLQQDFLLHRGISLPFASRTPRFCCSGTCAVQFYGRA